jgi:hypothetical protein
MNIRSKIYDFWLNSNIGIHNSQLYKKMLKEIPNNSKILDIGIGTGNYIGECVNIN